MRRNGGHRSMPLTPRAPTALDARLCHTLGRTQDTLSKRLRRWTRNPLGSARRGFPPGVVSRGGACQSAAKTSAAKQYDPIANCIRKLAAEKQTTPVGFEPPQAEHNGFPAHRLSHSDKASGNACPRTTATAPGNARFLSGSWETSSGARHRPVRANSPIGVAKGQRFIRLVRAWQTQLPEAPDTRGGTRNCSLLLRREALYPLGHTSAYARRLGKRRPQ